MDIDNSAFDHSHEQGYGEGQFSGSRKRQRSEGSIGEDGQRTKLYRTEESESDNMGRMPAVRSFEGASNNQFYNSKINNVGGNLTEIQNATLEFESALAIERDTSKICKNQALQSLPVASAAAHTSGLYQSNVARRECTKGTRTKVLEDIRSWLRSDNAAPVFWLTGAAGMGKTTIAMTICREIENHFNSPVNSPVIDGFDRCPLVSFFASRQLDSGEAKHFLPSICRRLADHSSSYGRELADALERDSTLATAEHDKQFNDLFVKPWEHASSKRIMDIPNPVVVVDALDENKCGFHFLEKLLSAVNNGKLGGLRFLVTSRTEPRIAKLCSSFEPDAVCRLQDVPVGNVNQDIFRYLQQELSGFREGTLQLIAERSCGLFIYAATVVKLVVSDDPDSRTLGEQQDVAEELLSKTTGGLLAELYTKIIDDALGNHQLIRQRRRSILYTIICTAHPIPARVVAQLTETRIEEDHQQKEKVMGGDFLHCK